MGFSCTIFVEHNRESQSMSKTYQPFEPDQLLLMPPSLQEWLPKDHLVYFLRDVLEQIDLSPIQDSYEREERGYPPYHPKMMTGLLLYGYANGVRSSRHLAKHCQEDVAFRVLTANNQPDFRTISDFRKRHLEALHHVFVEILRLCRAAGLVKFAHISLDGTKIKANASKHKAMSYGRMMSDETRLRQEIKALLKGQKPARDLGMTTIKVTSAAQALDELEAATGLKLR